MAWAPHGAMGLRKYERTSRSHVAELILAVCPVSYLLCDHHVALELLMAFVPSVLALTCSFTTGSDRDTRQEVIKSDHYDPNWTIFSHE